MLVREHGASEEIQLPRGLAIGCVEFGTQMNPTPRNGKIVADPALDHKELSCLFVIYEEAAAFNQMKLFDTGGFRDGFRRHRPWYVKPQGEPPCDHEQRNE